MKLTRKTVGLILLVVALLGFTILIAIRLLSNRPEDVSIVPARTKATFQTQINLAKPTTVPAPTLLASHRSPTVSVPNAQITLLPTSPLGSNSATKTPTPSPTKTGLITQSISPTVVPTETVLAVQGLSPTVTPSKTPTQIPTSILVTSAFNTTSTPTPATQLIEAGVAQYSMFIFLAALLTIAVSLIF